MRWSVLIASLAASSAFAFNAACALDTAARVGADVDARRVLERNPICVEARGEVPIAYAVAVRLFASPTILADVQAEYARLLPPGAKPEFVITQTAPNAYHYVNRLGQETHIRELHRGEHEGPATEAVFHAKGRRFFGEFQAVIHIAAEPRGEGVAYRARVYAYPENAVSRFFARHLRLVHLFFHSKTAEIETLSVRIAEGLAGRSALDHAAARCAAAEPAASRVRPLGGAAR
jgi:hypothetical protein